MQFTRDDIAPLAVGAAVLGAGGGGDSHLTEGMLAEMIRAHGPIEVLSVNEIAENEPVLPLALMGAPYVFSEMLVGRPLLEAVLERSTAGQGAPSAVVPIEMAGLNALVPLIAAAQFGLPVVDADFTGRGVPTLDMTSFLLEHRYPDTQLLADPLGRSLQLHASRELPIEQMLRPLVEMMGSLAAYSTFPLHGRDLHEQSLDGTLTHCLEVGRVFQQFPGSSAAEVDELLAGLGGARIAAGTVVERLSQPDPRGAEGPRVAVTLEESGLPGGPGVPLSTRPLARVDFVNEFHVVSRDGEILATVPDFIVVVDADSWIPLTVEQLGLGQQATVIALPAHPRWRTERGIEVMGPRAFGYATDFTPFESGEVRR